MPKAPTDVRQRILDEATRLFAEQGFEGTSLQELSDAVGIRKPSLLYHFNSKDALREAVVEGLLSHWKMEIPRLLAAAQGGHDRFSALIEAVVEFFTSDANRARLVLREIMDQPQATQDRIRDHLSPWTSLITEAIRLGQESGRVKLDVNPEAYIMQVVFMALGTVAAGDVAEAMVPGGDAVTMDKRIAELIRIARDSLFIS